MNVALALLACLDVAASPSPAPKTWHPPQLPPVWEREAPAPHADASSFLSRFLPSEETLGETCALAKPSDGRMNPSFSSPAEASCGILQLVVAASLPAAGTLSVTPLSCGHAVYRENSEQLFVGIYHFHVESDASAVERQFKTNGVPFVTRERSTVVWSFADADSKCAALVMKHVRQLKPPRPTAP